MYKLVSLFGPWTFKIFALIAGLVFYGYLLRRGVSKYAIVLCSFILYIPIMKRLPIISMGGGINLTNLFILVLAVMWFMQDRSKIQTPLKALFIIWVVLNIVSFTLAALTEDAGYFVGNVADLKRALDAVLMFVFALAIKEKKDLEAVVLSLILGTVALAFHGYVEGITSSGRIRGLLDQPNMTGAFLATHAALIFSLALGRIHWMWRLALVGSLFVVFGALVETGSRMGLLALFIACMAILLVSPSRKVAFLAVPIVLVVVMFPEIMPDKIHKRYQSMMAPNPTSTRQGGELVLTEENPDSSVGTRFAIWKGGLQIIRQYPILGAGFGLFTKEVAPYMVGHYGYERGRAAHNAYIKTAAELGIPALIVLLLTFYAALKHGWESYHGHKDPIVRWVARGLIGATIALACSNMTTSSFQDLEIMGYFWALVGIVLAAGAISDNLGGEDQATAPS